MKLDIIRITAALSMLISLPSCDTLKESGVSFTVSIPPKQKAVPVLPSGK